MALALFLARLLGSSCSSVPRSLPPVLCGSGTGPGLSQAHSLRHSLLSTWSLVLGPGFRVRSPTRIGLCCVYLRTRSERRLLPSIYPSLLRDGVTLWVECGFPPTRSKRSLLWIAGWYSFRMGSPFSGQILTI